MYDPRDITKFEGGHVVGVGDRMYPIAGGTLGEIVGLPKGHIHEACVGARIAMIAGFDQQVEVAWLKHQSTLPPVAQKRGLLDRITRRKQAPLSLSDQFRQLPYRDLDKFIYEQGKEPSPRLDLFVMFFSEESASTRGISYIEIRQGIYVADSSNLHYSAPDVPNFEAPPDPREEIIAAQNTGGQHAPIIAESQLRTGLYLGKQKKTQHGVAPPPAFDFPPLDRPQELIDTLRETVGDPSGNERTSIRTIPSSSDITLPKDMFPSEYDTEPEAPSVPDQSQTVMEDDPEVSAAQEHLRQLLEERKKK